MKQYKIELSLIAFGIIAVLVLFISQREALETKGLSHLAEGIGVPLDDVYIHCRYAENVLAGNGYCFNPGKMVTADTSPLWVLLIAIGGLFTPHLEIVAVLLSALFYLAVGVGIYRLSLILGMSRNWSMLVAILTLLSGRIAWTALSGMETSLACAIVIAALASYFKERHKLTTILLALGVAARPEILLLAGILFLDQLFRVIKKNLTAAQLLVNISIFLICALPVFLLPLIERGSIIYHSSLVQGAEVSLLPNWTYLLFVAKIFVTSVGLPFVLAILSLYYLRKDRRFLIIGAFTFGLPIILAFVAPQFRHHGRYFFSVIPLIILLGIAYFSEKAKLRNGSFLANPLLVRTLLVFMLAFGVFVFVRWVWIYKYSVTNIAGQHVAAAKWVGEHATSEDVIASHDLGAIGYFTKRTVIDLVGLVTPEIYPLLDDQKRVWEYARAHGATIFIIYNRLNPTFYQFAKDSLDLQASLTADPLVSSADTVMSIYRIKQR